MSDDDKLLVTIKGVTHHFWRREAAAALRALQEALGASQMPSADERCPACRWPASSGHASPEGVPCPRTPGLQEASSTHRLKCRIIELEAVLREASEWFGGGDEGAYDGHEGDRIRARMRSTLTKGLAK